MTRILFITLIFMGCDSTDRTRDPTTGFDASLMDSGASPNQDMAVTHSDGGMVDSDPIEEVLDAGSSMPREETPEDECNAQDDDGDGEVDEGISNPCGGCGGIPPGGCQHWRINLVSDGEGELNPDRTVGLAASFLGVSTVDVPNGTCLIQRLQMSQGRDDHLGPVTLEREAADVLFTPVFDPEASQVGYQHDVMGEWIGLSDGESVAVDARGGQDIPAFRIELEGPPSLELDPPDALTAFVDAVRGEAGTNQPEIHWVPRQDDDGVRFYIGGSRVVFRRVRFYQAIEHYVLDGRLADDGEFTLPEAFVGAGIAQASTWIHASRLRLERRVFGPHAVSVLAGSRYEARGRGGMADADMPPFQIQNPNPNTRDFTPGDPLPVRWSELPEGEGPLVVMLSYRDAELGAQTVVSCTADDPHLGELILPPDLTVDVPDEVGAFRQINVRWTQDAIPLAAPDDGVFTRATSVILNFTR